MMLLLIGSGVALTQTLSDIRITKKKQTPEAKKPLEPVRVLPNGNDAIRLAYAHIQTVPEHLRCYTRYIFIQDSDLRSMRTTSVALQYDSRASGIIRPLPVAGPMLLVINLAYYAPRPNDLQEWTKFWEEFAFDPMFALLITRDTADFLNKHRHRWPTIRTTETRRVSLGHTRMVKHPGGRFTYPADCVHGGRSIDSLDRGNYELETLEEQYRQERIESLTDVVLGKDVDVVRFNSEGIDPSLFQKLQEETHSFAPVVEHRYFKSRFLKTIKDDKDPNKKNDDNVFKTIFGGLYYEFTGIKKSKDPNVTDQDLFFESIGIGNIKGGVTADVLFDRIRSDHAAVMTHSKVTGDIREVLSFQTPNTKDSISWGSITGDIRSKRIDIKGRQFANLLTPQRDAREGIFPKANAFLLFTMFNGVGALQDEVPFDIANDYMIPRPFHQRLDSLGCITCHSMDGKDGWQDYTNDVKDLIVKRFDIFDDRGLKHRTNSDIIDRLAGRYTAVPKKNLSRARDDFAEATLRASGPWKESKDQINVCKLVATRLHEEYGSYWWTLVDAQIALQELGLQVSDKKEAVKLFQQIITPDPKSLVKGVFLEDPRIALISGGLKVGRTDWALAYSFVLERANRSPIFRKLRSGK